MHVICSWSSEFLAWNLEVTPPLDLEDSVYINCSGECHDSFFILAVKGVSESCY